MRVAFVHPNLGIGGAENLVVNAAVALKQKGHIVTMYTAHHDPGHCFPETTGGGLLADTIRVYGDWLPQHVFLRLHVICAILRMFYVSLIVILFGDHDVIFCDQVSHCVPLLRLGGKPVLFYCHYPDKLLCTQRESFLKRLYRAPVDWIEEVTTGASDKVVVNSRFTASVFKDAFKSIKLVPDVLYPPINVDKFVPPSADGRSSLTNIAKATKSRKDDAWAKAMRTPDCMILLSINRFERKKNIGLAVEALAELRAQLPKADAEKVHLVLAGGFDPQNTENKEHFDELRELVLRLALDGFVHFFPSFSDDEKVALLQCARCVVYTPDKEHFGIVPIEAMYAGVPVIAVASGGPLETVKEGVTGYLCPNTPAAFAGAMKKLCGSQDQKARMGLKGNEWVKEKFTLGAFADQLETFVLELHAPKQR